MGSYRPGFEINRHSNKVIELNRIMGCVNGKPVLSDADLEYIVKNTSISRGQIDDQYENFLEKHPDGKITKRNFRDMMQACFPESDIAKLESHIFRMYDKNGDGHIDFGEFMIALYVMSNGTPEENLKQIFRIFDINNDGSISQEELRCLVKDLFKMFPQKKGNPNRASQKNLANLAFKEMDTNGDGRISQEEFVKACLSQESISKMLALKVIDVFVGKE